MPTVGIYRAAGRCVLPSLKIMKSIFIPSPHLDYNKLSSYWKTPGRQVYSDTLWGCVKSTLWCHIGIKFAKTPKALREILGVAAIIVWAALGAFALPGCSTTQLAATGTIAGDLVTDVLAGTVAVSDAYTALSATQQAMQGHGVSVQNIGAYANAAISSANTSGLLTAVNTIIADVSSQIAAGFTPAAIDTQVTNAQTAIAAVAPTIPVTSSLWTPAKVEVVANF